MEDPIEALWRWFYQNNTRITTCISGNSSAEEQEYIVETLNNLTVQLGEFAWDISKGVIKPWAFTLSPNGNELLLEQSKLIIEEAPQLAEWEFNYCKPALAWDFLFHIFDSELQKKTVNASNWHFTFSLDDDQRWELFLEADNIPFLDDATAQEAAEEVVLNSIGEEAMILDVSSIKITNKFKEDSPKHPIQSLKKLFFE